MAFSEERFKNITAGVQSIVLSAAVVVGGIWTWGTFSAKLEAENARAQLTKIEREIAAVAKPEFSIAISRATAIEGSRIQVVGEISIKNPGSQDILWPLEDKPIHVFSVGFNEGGEPIWTPVARVNFHVSNQQTTQNLEVLAGATKSMPFAFAIPGNSGSYAIRVASLRPPNGMPNAPLPGQPPLGKTYWGQVAYFELERLLAPPNPSIERTLPGKPVSASHVKR